MYAVYWLIASAVFLLVEIMTLGLTSIWFAGGAVVAAIAALFGVPFLVQMLIFIVVTCLLFALTRPVAKRYLNSKVQKNEYRCIDRTDSTCQRNDQITWRAKGWFS